MELRCIKCGHKVSRLYIQYSQGNIRLVKCGNCKSVADEYIECELMILIMDLILHKPQAYRHLLFNMLHHSALDFGTLLLRSSLIFLVLDACKIWILNSKSEEWFSLGLGLKSLLCALSGNLVFLSFLLALSRRFLKFVDGFNGPNYVLLAMIVSSYLKVYTLAMAVWEFPMSVLYIVDLFVMSSNLVALRVITESSFRRCVGVCLCAHALKFFNQLNNMGSQESSGETTSPAATTPTMTSCRRKKKDDATFLEDIKEHIDEFVNASMDEHKSCFTKTMKKMFRMSEVVAQRNSEYQEVESVLPLQTTVVE